MREKRTGVGLIHLVLAVVAACRAPGAVERDRPRTSSSQPGAVSGTQGFADAATHDAEGLEPHPLAGAPATFDGPRTESLRAGDFDVIVARPTGMRGQRPIVVGVHGSHDRPEAACARWQRTLGGWPFVVCPTGVPWHGGLAWGSPAILAERIDRAVAALHERHGGDIAQGSIVYAGWSLGATLGPKVVASRPGMFGTVILAEVGHTRIDPLASITALRTGRASRTIVACATRRCAAFAKRLVGVSKGGPAVAIVDGGIGRGHVFDEQMGRAVGAAVTESVSADVRWSGLGAAREAISTSDGGSVLGEPFPSLDNLGDEEPDLSGPPDETP